MQLLAHNGFRISPAYFHRAAFVTATSLGNSVCALIDKARFGADIAKTEIRNPPLFILGHWRSGTTLLHDLLSRDVAQFNFANTYRVVNPLTFKTTENFITKALPGLVPPTRPMDNMELKFSSPQEDEFAPLLMTLKSVYMGISFPNNTADYEKYLSFKDVPERERSEWKDAFHMFCQKLSLDDRRSLVLKSPPHTARIKMLLEVFPDARFVHIHRDPYRVFQSQRHFFDTACWYTYFQKPDLDAIDEGILNRHEAMYDAYFEDLALIPEGNFCDVAFDDLEADPVGQIASIYNQLALPGYETLKPSLEAYVASLEGYRKNTFSGLDNATRNLVAERWKRSFETWNYPL